MSINKKSLTPILESLNDELKKINIERELKVFGSGALILLNLVRENRTTVDLDMLSPTGDIQLLRASEKVANKHDLDPEWLNSIGSRFIKYLPANWNNRLNLVYNASNLKIYSLDRKDLLTTKIKALYNRNESDDLDDLISIAQSFEEIKQTIAVNSFSDQERLQRVLSQIRQAYENL